jgi:hypothetical protein
MKGVFGKVAPGRVLEEKRTTAHEVAAHVRAQARRAGMTEYAASELQPHGRYVRDPLGRLFRPARGAVATSDGSLIGTAQAFVIDGAEVRFLLRAEPGTVAELEQRQAERERRVEEREQERREFVAAQPLEPLTAADVGLLPGKAPTLRRACETLEDAGCTISLGPHGEVVVAVPARLAPAGMPGASRDKIVAAARVLLAAEKVVVAELGRRSTKPLSARLPDAPVSAGGGVTEPGS